LAGIGTLVFPGCQRVIEPVSRLFFINPSTKSERTPQIKAGVLSNQNFFFRKMENYFIGFIKNE
jgi:hypothetical protein